MKRDSSTIWFVALAMSAVVAVIVVVRRRRSHQADSHHVDARGSGVDDISSDGVIDSSGKDSFPASDPPATY